MKKFISFAILFISFVVSSSAQTLVGDMNGDGQLTIEDLTLLVNTLIGERGMTYNNPDGSTTTYSPITISLEYPTATANFGSVTPTFTATQTKTITSVDGKSHMSKVELVPTFSFTDPTDAASKGATINSSTGVITWSENTSTSERSVSVTYTVTGENGRTKTTTATCTQSGKPEEYYVYYGASDTLPGDVETLEGYSKVSIESTIPTITDYTKYHWIAFKSSYGYSSVTAIDKDGDPINNSLYNENLEDYVIYEHHFSRGKINNTTTFTIT